MLTTLLSFLPGCETSRVAQQSRRRPLSIQKVRRLERQVAHVNDADNSILVAVMALSLSERVWECIPPPF